MIDDKWYSCYAVCGVYVLVGEGCDGKEKRAKKEAERVELQL